MGAHPFPVVGPAVDGGEIQSIKPEHYDLLHPTPQDVLDVRIGAHRSQLSGQTWMAAKSMEGGRWFTVKFWPVCAPQAPGFAASRAAPGPQKPSAPTVTRWFGSISFTKVDMSSIQRCTETMQFGTFGRG